MHNITKNTQKAIPRQEKIKTNETIKTPEYNTQKFDTNINQKMYNYFSFEIPTLLSTDAVLTLAPEVVVRRCFSKYVFLNILQISQENKYVGVSF